MNVEALQDALGEAVARALRESYSRPEPERRTANHCADVADADVAGCARRLWHHRTGPSVRRPFSVGTLLHFARGTHFQKLAEAALASLGDEGTRIVPWGSIQYEGPQHQENLAGHPDLVVVGPDYSPLAVVEVKAPESHTDVPNDLGDLLMTRSPWLLNGLIQTALYCYLLAVPVGYILYMSPGALRAIKLPFEEHPDLIEPALEKARVVERAIQRGEEVPPREYAPAICSSCPYLALCPVERTWGARVVETGHDELIGLVRRREELKEAAAELKEVEAKLAAAAEAALPDGGTAESVGSEGRAVRIKRTMVHPTWPPRGARPLTRLDGEVTYVVEAKPRRPYARCTYTLLNEE